MSEPSPARILSFAVTTALLAGGAGCTDDSRIYSNPGPVRQPSASPSPGASPAPSAAETPAPEGTPVVTPDVKPDDIMTNPGPDPDGPR